MADASEAAEMVAAAEAAVKVAEEAELADQHLELRESNTAELVTNEASVFISGDAASDNE